MGITQAGKIEVLVYRAISGFGLAKMLESVDTPAVLLPVDTLLSVG
jgi:hypothetical protein